MEVKLWKKIFNGALYAALAGTILTVIPALQVDFELPKMIIFRAGVWMMALSLGMKWLLEGKVVVPKVARKWCFWFIICALLAMAALETAVSPMWRLSFWGGYERADGTLRMLYLLGFFLLTIFGVREKLIFERAFKVLFSAILVVLIYGLMQAVGLDLLGYNLEELTLGRVFSTLGHPNFLAALIVAVALPMWQFLRENLSKFYAYGWVVIVIVLIILTKSRAGLLALLIEGMVYSLIISYWKGNWLRILKKLAILMVGIALLVAFLAQTGKHWFNAERSVNYRLELWQRTVEASLEKPLLGHGIATFGVEFQDSVTAEMVKLEATNVIADKPHNIVLQVLFEGGIIGVVIWLVILGTTVSQIFKLRKGAAAAMISSLFGLLICWMFGFSTLSELVVMVFLLAYNFSLFSGQEKILFVEILKQKMLKRLMMIFLTLGVALALVCQSVLPLSADFFAQKAVNQLPDGAANEVVKNLLIAHALSPDTAFYSYLLAETLIQVNDFVHAEKYLQLAGANTNFRDGYYFYVTAKLAQKKCENGSEEMCAKANENYHLALEKYPYYPLFRLAYGVFQAKTGNCKMAEGLLKSYVELIGDNYKSDSVDDRRRFSKQNQEFGLALKYLSRCKVSAN